MNFAPFTGHIPTAAAIPSIHQFAAKFGYEGTGGGVVQETRYQTGAGGAGVQFAVAPTAGVDGVKFRQADSVVVVSSAPPGSIALAGIGPLHTGIHRYINPDKVPIQSRSNYFVCEYKVFRLNMQPFTFGEVLIDTVKFTYI